MRCPNALCRAIFEVRDAAEPGPPPISPPPAPSLPPPPLPKPPQTGAVGNLVPILPAEAVTASPTAPPFPLAPGRFEPALATPAAEPRPTLDEFFANVAPLTQTGPEPVAQAEPAFAVWEAAPPVRQGQEAAAAANGMAPLPEFAEAQAGPEIKHRVARWPYVLLAVVLLSGGGVIFWLASSAPPTDEAERFAKAEKEYKARNFPDAAALFLALVHDFKDSEKRPTYQFYAELSDIIDKIHGVQTEADETQEHLGRLRRFLGTYETDPLLAGHRDDITESLYRLVEELTKFAARDKDRELLTIARQLYADTGKSFKKAPPPQDVQIKEGLESAEKIVALEETRQQVLKTLNDAIRAPSMATVQSAIQQINVNNLGQDPEINALKESLPEHHRKAIRFDEGLAFDSSPSIVADTPLSVAVLQYRGNPPALGSSLRARPAFTLVRGVLYAFDPHTGSSQWVRRVGVDCTALPVWLPATSVTPPSVVIGTSSPTGLLALQGDDGSPRWFLPLPEQTLGQPLLVGNRLFVACRSGIVHEIDHLNGRCLGGYRLGEELAHGGVLQPDTANVLFAANRGCVFMLDVERRQCTGLLYTDHPSGALRCGPIVLPGSQGKLLLCQDDGQGNTLLLGYSLPFSDPEAKPVSLADKLPGRLSYPPVVNSQTISLITDAGAFAVLGLRQRENLDGEVFPMLRENLSPTPAAMPGRPMVVHADGGRFWLLAQRRLNHYEAAISSKDGWRIVPHPLPLPTLGTALHASQVEVDDHGRAFLFVVTEASDGRACRMTAVDLQTNALRWQCQIGLVPHNTPLALGDKVLIWDHGGNLLLFDSAKSEKQLDPSWQLLDRSAERHGPANSYVLAHGDGKTAVALAVQGRQLDVWRFDGRVMVPMGGAVELEAPLGGNPVLLEDKLVLPLANGRLVLVDGGHVYPQGDWRSPLADKNVTGHLTVIGGGKLASTDGSNGLTIWQLSGQKLMSESGDHVTVAKQRIIAPPAVLASGGQLRLCVADVGRCVTLLRGDDLRPIREWTLDDAITAGPFVSGGGIGVVVAGRRLVWLDPDAGKLRWAITFPARIVGEPQLIDGRLIVADASGRIQNVDPATGGFVGSGCTLRADVAAAATPLPFGPDQLFVPLTDGTVLLPPKN